MDPVLDYDSPYTTWTQGMSIMAPKSSSRRIRIRKSRGRGLRTTNGWRRHLKCDEGKPICGPCVNKDKICEYANPADGPKAIWTPESANDETPASIIQQNGSPQTSREISSAVIPDLAPFEPHEIPPAGWTSPDLNDNPHPGGVNDQDPGSDVLGISSPIIFQNNQLSPTNAAVAAVRWFGLLTSDVAKDSPQQSIIPNSWETEGLLLEKSSNGTNDPSSLQRATQVLDSPPASNGIYDPIDPGTFERAALAEGEIWHSRDPIELLANEQVLFVHFVQHVSSWIDLFDPTNQFSTFVAHLAIHNAGLLNAILALALRHLALNPHQDTQNIPEKEDATVQYYYQTLHYVHRAMQYPTYKTSLELLATTLIISAYEMLDNSTNGWERHLEGVFLIQRSQTIHGESGGLHSAVWWAWLCQDIWAAFREQRKTLTFWVPQKPLPVLLPHELANRAIYHAAKVISFCADATTETTIQSRMDEANRLRGMLDDWQQHLTIEFSPLPLGPRETSSCFKPIWISPPAFAVAVQFFSVSHILLLAHEPSIGGLEQYTTRQSMIKRYIEDICGIAMTLKDSASSVMSSQALFIAGLFTQDKDAREAILALLVSCRQRSGWPASPLGLELQQLWDCPRPSSVSKWFM
ncbi:uncharacterized protein N7503_010517 [Penicillium pulvis]|uniref:uncharacterized protein n=1 Tax=Penicillium pulvis TaxID=1562058 RepID=UPI0025466CAB|nr:uncharacterized protein N7503_010517 [Penicillium pulvis]KAJ5785305.1 hypothetical protein N7503_010517 [Penicillium pulvis]